MASLLKTHIRLWQDRDYLRAAIGGMVLFGIALVAAWASWEYLQNKDMHEITPPDFFLDRLPALKMENILVWGVPLLTGIVIAALAVYPHRLPFLLQSAGLLILLRSFFVILTPMGMSPDQVVTSAQGLFQNLAYGSNDFFFSGHVAIPFLFALVFWEQPLVRFVMFGFSAIFAIGVLLAHTHYSIDVFAVPLIVPSVYRVAVYVFGKKGYTVSLGYEQRISSRQRFPAMV